MEWTRGHTLGRGSTAAVYIAESCHSGQVFAVKSAELHRSEFLQREERILSTLKCPQIVAYQGCDITFENGVHWFNVFMEYAPHGTLAEHGGCMEEVVVGSYTRQILQGLNYLHSNGIVHCDVKGRNVLVTEQGAKIADLGCARRVGESSSVIAGTPAFMAPEVARGEQQGFPADVWALGCTVLEMITGKPPWHGGGDPAAAVYRIAFSGEVPEIPSFVSEQGRDFLGKCLKREPNERWSVEELLGHGFVKECSELKLLLDWDTPTSVLERGFWDSLETTQHRARDCLSPRDRIRRLFSDEPIWEWNDDWQWVTVRNNEVHHMHLDKTDTFCNFVFDEEGLTDTSIPSGIATRLLMVTPLTLPMWSESQLFTPKK
ncbi:Mitogen-activated protein kinase kinase kinase 17, partial [Mucuna pruriens]